MIIVQFGGYGTSTLEFQENETVSAMLQRLKDSEHVGFRTVAILQETQTGRALAADEIIADGRIYHLTVTLEPAPKQ